MNGMSMLRGATEGNKRVESRSAHAGHAPECFRNGDNEGEDSEGDHSEGVEEQHVDAEQLIHWSMQSSREGSRIQMPQRTWKIGGKDSVTKSVVATESECVVRRRNSRQLDNEQDGCRSEAMTFPSLQ
jgi:hypothetical protein